MSFLNIYTIHMRQLNNALIIFSKEYSNLNWFLLCVFSILNCSCQDNNRAESIKVITVKPAYSDIKLITRDTLHFPLGKDTYNRVKSFNYFTTSNGKEYISFYDRRSESVVIYDFKSRMPVNKLPLSKVVKGRKFYKTSAYVHDFDRIYLTNKDKLYLIDSSGKVHRDFVFSNMESIGFFDNPQPVVVKGNITFMGLRPLVSEKSLSDIKAWKVMGAFDLARDVCNIHYSLPAVYGKGLYGRRFLEYSYCYNNKKKFVFSFPADSNIYETDLAEYHLAYSGKSKYQAGAIEPIGKQALDRDEGGQEYKLRDSYGPIYFDPYKKRYLRVAKHKLTKEALVSKTVKRKITIIVFDQHFRIIGEFDFNNEYLLDSIFFSSDGSMYARVNRKDENALHFVRLIWENEPTESTNLTKK